MPDSRRVLVVDDDPDEAEALLMLLDRAGYDVRIAFDGPSALELAGTFTPDVAVLDINMPGMDGYEVAGELRRRLGPARPAIIALTGEPPELVPQVHAFDYRVAKPAKPKQIIELVKTAVPDRRKVRH